LYRRYVPGSDGTYNREHRIMCQKPFMNSFSLEQFSRTVEDRVGLLLNAWWGCTSLSHSLKAPAGFNL
jgi:hypothetical protein